MGVSRDQELGVHVVGPDLEFDPGVPREVPEWGNDRMESSEKERGGIKVRSWGHLKPLRQSPASEVGELERYFKGSRGGRHRLQRDGNTGQEKGAGSAEPSSVCLTTSIPAHINSLPDGLLLLMDGLVGPESHPLCFACLGTLGRWRKKDCLSTPLPLSLAQAGPCLRGFWVHLG